MQPIPISFLSGHHHDYTTSLSVNCSVHSPRSRTQAVMAVPQHADSELLNSQEMRGHFAVVARGLVSFAEKCVQLHATPRDKAPRK